MKKLTDNEIVKMLECCKQEIDSNGVICGECKKCPNYEGETGLCKEDLPTIVLNLINRQKAEIERLQNTLDDVLDRQPTLVERSEKYAKAEAYKEFAERLKESKKKYEGTLAGWTFTMTELNNLLKELVGEDNAG